MIYCTCAAGRSREADTQLPYSRYIILYIYIYIIERDITYYRYITWAPPGWRRETTAPSRRLKRHSCHILPFQPIL